MKIGLVDSEGNSALAFKANMDYDVAIDGVSKGYIHVSEGMYMVVHGAKRKFLTEEQLMSEYKVVE